MRHRNKLNHLGRTSEHRKAMLANMAVSLIKHKRIKTTLAKAKVLKSYIEPLLTKSKVDSTHSRRVVFSHLQDKLAVAELFREIAIKIANRPGGYTRILKTGYRNGDNAQMCFIELVDYNVSFVKQKLEKAKTTRRSRSRKKKTVEELKEKGPDKTTKQSLETPEKQQETIASSGAETPSGEVPASETEKTDEVKE
ncbi:MAG: 50S ribosomal protein L17 [Bacteroidia bacterium]|nr:50S ribosomal protein L17 [Bacteroidia bacterium]